MSWRVDLNSRITRIRADLPNTLDTTVRRGAEAIAQDAQSRAPVSGPEGGDLRDSIHTEKVADGEWKVVAGDDEEVYYGHLVEFGTTRSAAHPFLVPAAESQRNDILAAINRALKSL